ncbi:MAG: Gfo/Idh/MocA family oxidoreductase [Betaproteobacteria bacterium]
MNSPLRIGVIGLGRAFTLMLPTFQQDPRVQLVAATDPLPQACAQFEKDFHGQVTPHAEALCALRDIDLIYIASPHGLHAQHTALAAQHGKHVWVEKPMAVSLSECQTMIQACRDAGVQLMVGHSHSFNAPVLRAYELIQSGRLGQVKMITALNYTDFLYRPRRPEELNTALGGGVIHSQASHQVDVVRLLGGGQVSTVQACTGQWDAARPTEGAYSALLKFESGAFANLTYNGYGHFDSDVWMDHVGEIGNAKPASESAKRFGTARKRLATTNTSDQESQLKAARNYGGSLYQPTAQNEDAYQHFGPVLVSCEKADLRLTPKGLWMYGPEHETFEALPTPIYPRKEVIDELWGALREGKFLLHSGTWARATTEVCLSLLEAAQTGQAIHLKHQVAVHHA